MYYQSYLLIDVKLTFAEHTVFVTDHLSRAILGEQSRTALGSLCSLFPYDMPNMFFQVRRDENPQESRAWDHLMEKVLNEIYQILFGIDFPETLACTMRHCVNALPAGAILYQSGFMVPRKTEAVSQPGKTPECLKTMLTGLGPDYRKNYAVLPATPSRAWTCRGLTVNLKKLQ